MFRRVLASPSLSDSYEDAKRCLWNLEASQTLPKRAEGAVKSISRLPENAPKFTDWFNMAKIAHSLFRQVGANQPYIVLRDRVFNGRARSTGEDKVLGDFKTLDADDEKSVAERLLAPQVEEHPQLVIIPLRTRPEL